MFELPVAVHRFEGREQEVRCEFPSSPKDLVLHVLLVSLKPWYICYCSVDTELYCRYDGAQDHFDVLFTTDEMDSLLASSFAS